MLGKLFGKKKKVGEERAKMETKSFFDCIAPATIRFYANYFLVGDTYRCVWVIREYPPSTEEQAILSHLADHSGVTLRIYNRLVEAYEQRQIANNAARKNRLKLGDTDINESIQAEQNLLDVQQLLVTLSREKQPLLHCAVFGQKHECFGEPAVRYQHGADPFQDHRRSPDSAAERGFSLRHALWL